MSAIVPGVNRPVIVDSLKQTIAIADKPKASGVVDQQGVVPQASTPTMQSNLVASLQQFMPAFVKGDTDVLLMEMTLELKQTVQKAESEKLVIAEEKKRTSLAEKKEKFDEATKKIEDAIKERENASIWDKISMAFQALGAILSVVVGVIVSAIPGAQVLGGLMIAGGVVAMISVIDNIVKEATGGMGILGNITYAIAKADGATDEEAQSMAQKADMGMSIILAVTGIALGLATIFSPTSLSSSLLTASNVANSIMTGVTATGDVAAGVVRYKASEKEAEGKTLKAEGTELQALVEELDSFIDMIFEQISQSSNRFNMMIDSIAEGLADDSNTISRARFSA